MSPGPQALHYERMVSYGLATVEIKLTSGLKTEGCLRQDVFSEYAKMKWRRKLRACDYDLIRSADVFSYSKRMARELK